MPGVWSWWSCRRHDSDRSLFWVVQRVDGARLTASAALLLTALQCQRRPDRRQVAIALDRGDPDFLADTVEAHGALDEQKRDEGCLIRRQVFHETSRMTRPAEMTEEPNSPGSRRGARASALEARVKAARTIAERVLGARPYHHCIEPSL